MSGDEFQTAQQQAHWAEETVPAAAEAGAGPALALDENDRLPWLESADEDEDYGEVDQRRVMAFVAGGLVLLAAIVGGIWWGTHRGDDTGPKVAEGGVIKAPETPYKVAPANPGGKTYEGTGDSSFAVSQGKGPVAHLGEGSDGGPSAPPAMAAKPEAKPEAKAETAKKDAAPAAGAGTGGVGVQVGAYSNQATAEAGWTRLSKQVDALSGVNHRIVQGQAEMGTVYRLQAVAGSDAAADALCSTLKAHGVACQVKH